MTLLEHLRDFAIGFATPFLLLLVFILLTDDTPDEVAPHD